MKFGEALEELKVGTRVMRTGWNGKGMWLKLIHGSNWSQTNCVDYMLRDDEFDPSQSEVSVFEDLKLLPWIGMKTADGGFVPWLASQTDILAEDWEVFHG